MRCTLAGTSIGTHHRPGTNTRVRALVSEVLPEKPNPMALAELISTKAFSPGGAGMKSTHLSLGGARMKNVHLSPGNPSVKGGNCQDGEGSRS
jgi:hypothetical protein